MEPLSTNELQAVRDELSRGAIRNVMFRYCRGLDRAEEEVMRSVYHPDATDAHGPFHGSSLEFLAHLVPLIHDSVLPGMQHSVQNMLIELDGDVARVETYFQATLRLKRDPGVLTMFGGRYLDRFERRDGTNWLIARRSVVNDWSLREEMPSDEAGTAGFVAAQFEQRDLVYQAETWTGA